MKHLYAAVLMAIPLTLQAANHDEIRSTLEDQTRVAVTIYNQDLALVRDTRKLTLKKGTNRLALREVSAMIRPETALLRSLSHGKGFYVLEQNFDFDLLSPNKLLEKYVGRKVGVVRTHPTTGAETVEDAILLSNNGGAVLRVGNRIEMRSPGRIVFPEVPDNLRDRPTLVTELVSATNKPQTLNLSYLTGGLNWKADYVAELNDKDTQLDLNGWVTLTNRSGTTYRDATLQLVAGDVNRVRQEMRYAVGKAAPALMAEDASREMVREALFEYHLYTLPRNTTIAENQTKQVALLSASSVPVKKELILHGNEYYYRSSHGDIGQKMKVGVYVKFKNDKASGMGKPLPKGIVRVYKKDSKGNAQFVGEDRIDHTPKNEKVKLKLGNAFDVTADKKQTRFKKQPAVGKYHYVYDSSYEILLKNAKEEDVTVTVLEPIPGDWQMINESHSHEQVAAGTSRWRIKVPAGGKTKLEYTVRVRF